MQCHRHLPALPQRSVRVSHGVCICHQHLALPQRYVHRRGTPARFRSSQLHEPAPAEGSAQPLTHRAQSLLGSSASPPPSSQPRPPPEEPAPGSRVRLQTPSAIPFTRAQHWQLLQSLVPAADWPAVRLTLAALETTYRAQSQQFAAAAIAALQAANTLHVLPDGGVAAQQPLPTLQPIAPDTVVDLLPTASKDEEPDCNQTGSGALNGNSSTQRDTHGAHSNGSNGVSKDMRTGPSSGEPPAQADALSDTHNLRLGHLQPEPSQLTQQAQQLQGGQQQQTGQQQARQQPKRQQQQQYDDSSLHDPAEFDSRLAAWVALLVRQAHFDPLTQRDTAVADVLNAEAPGKLFIGTDIRRMDRGLVQLLQEEGAAGPSRQRTPAEQGAETASSNPSLAEGGADPPLALGLPAEGEGLLLLYRGWRQGESKGRLTLQKLDYLQTLVVMDAWQALEQAGKWVWTNGVAVVQRARGASQAGPGQQAGALGTDPALPGSSGQTDSSSAGPNSLKQAAASASQAAESWWRTKLRRPRHQDSGLHQLDRLLPVQEPAHVPPFYLGKATLAEVMGPAPYLQGLGRTLSLLLQPVTLQEPAFQEFAVVWRPLQKAAVRGPLHQAVQAGRRLGLLSRGPIGPQPRPPVCIRVYQDLPLPTWKVALPDGAKQLQFRPLDLLRTDLVAITGLLALLAQARFDNLILDIIFAVSASVFLVRISLGYQRMADRYRQEVEKVLRERTVASDGPALEYLAQAGARQQFMQTSLAWVLALQAQQQQQQGQQQRQAQVERGGTLTDGVNASVLMPSVRMSSEQLATQAQAVLLQHSQVQVAFDAAEALSELNRLGLASAVKPAPMQTLAASLTSQSLDLTASDSSPGLQQGSGLLSVAEPTAALQRVQAVWDCLLWEQVDTILTELQ